MLANISSFTVFKIAFTVNPPKWCKITDVSPTITFIGLQVLSHFRDGKLSPTELCTKCLERLRKVKQLNAFISELPENALSAADNSSLRLRNGKCIVYCYKHLLSSGPIF